MYFLSGIKFFFIKNNCLDILVKEIQNFRILKEILIG